MINFGIALTIVNDFYAHYTYNKHYTQYTHSKQGDFVMNELQTINKMDVVQINESSSILICFLASLDVKPKTKDTYRKAIKQFNKWIEGRGIAWIERTHILEYKAYLMENYSASTVSAYITAVKILYKWLEAENISPNITEGIKGAKSSKGFKKDTLTVQQAKRILTNIGCKTVKQLRDYALINLLLRTGLRTIEVRRANIEDIRQEAGTALLYIQGKGRDSKDAFVILTAATLEPLEAYLKARGDVGVKGALFAAEGNRSRGKHLTTRSIRRIIKEAMRAANIDSDRLTAHSLRHTAITFSLLGGAKIQEVQQMARHTNINTTLIYAHNIERIGQAPERKIDEYLDNTV